MLSFSTQCTAFLLTAVLITACSQPKTVEDLKKEIINKFENEPGQFALAFKDLSTDEIILINERVNFHAASTMKTPVLIELYKQAAEGKFSLQDSILIKNSFYSIVDSSIYQLTPEEDSEKENYLRVGQKRTIYDLAYDMIIMSSNLATNLLIDLVDAKKVNQTMYDFGAVDINVLRGVEDLNAFDKGLNNSTNAFDLMVIFEKLANGEAVSPKASLAMINILMDQKFKDVIPSQLPAEVKTANKTGSITALHHDSAIVFLPDGRKYILVLLSHELADFDRGTEFLASISKTIYDFVVSK